MNPVTFSRNVLTKRVLVGTLIVAASATAAAIITVSAASSNSATQSVATVATTATSASPNASTRNGHRHPLLSALVIATAKETGMPVTTIRQELQRGETLDQIAGSKAAAVKSDVLSALQTRLDKRVHAGKITQQQETKRLTAAQERIDTLMGRDLKRPAS